MRTTPTTKVHQKAAEEEKNLHLADNWRQQRVHGSLLAITGCGIQLLRESV